MTEENTESVETTDTVVNDQIDPETGQSYEEVATKFGWDENYEGENKVDAKTFVEKGRNINGMLRNNVESLEKKISEMEENFKASKQFYDQKLTAQENRHQQELEARKMEAVQNGDVEAYEAIRKEEEAVQPQNDFSADPAVQDFIDRNDWYGADEAKTLMAEAYSQKLAAQSPTLTVAQNLKRVEAYVNEQFKVQKPASPVESGRRVTPKSGSKTYDAMPQADKDGCDRAVRIGMCTKDEFVKNYWDSQ